MTKSYTDPAKKPQIDKFRDLARELECDDDEAAFDEALRRLAQPHAPMPDGPSQKGD